VAISEDWCCLRRVQAAELSSGDGALFGVSSYDVATGGEAELVTTGVFTLSKATGAVAQGTPLFWDDAARKVTTAAEGNTRVGVAIVPAANTDATVQVRLNGSF